MIIYTKFGNLHTKLDLHAKKYIIIIVWAANLDCVDASYISKSASLSELILLSPFPGPLMLMV